MKKLTLFLLTFILLCNQINAQLMDSTQMVIDSIEASFEYQTGIIDLPAGHAKITVPEGFRFLNGVQANYLLSDLWGNPSDTTVLGLLVPAERGLLADNSWVFVVTYEEMGFVKDDDAEDIDYDEMLTELQKESAEVNPEREKMGYEAVNLIGWASEPFYDKDKKILHWAKELQFGENEYHTLNYNLRVLGRKGVFMLNAVASMTDLPEVKSSMDKVISSVEFESGNRYADFDPKLDEVAAWTIGGLVAGKILAKVGLFAVMLKFWKIIGLAIVGAGAGIWKFIKGRQA